MHEEKTMRFSIVFALALLGLLQFASSANLAKTHYHDFIIKETPYTRLCHTKNILTVNGQFPGPTIYARKGDTVIVRVFNRGDHNVTIHWHGVDQPRNPWSDGPEYITQCPIQPGANFTYRVQLTDQEGTIWWHSHSDWTRATVHGAIVVRPKIGTTFPFPAPHKEIPIIIGEWWNGDVNQVIEEALRTGGDPNLSDAYTINGQPGDFYPCDKQKTFTAMVEYGKTYLLRVVNGALSNGHFFGIAGHRLTVVGKDASYTKPFTASYVLITPGQTMDLLLHANNTNSRYYIVAKPYSGGVGVPFNRANTTAVLRYKNPRAASPGPLFPNLPASNDSNADNSFAARLRSLASREHPVDVPKSIDKRIVITVSVNEILCPPGRVCKGPDNNRFAASLNNISFVNPSSMDVLRAYYQKIGGVFGTGFPDRPPLNFNFTADDLPKELLFPRVGTEVKVLEYGARVEIVFQGTNLLAGENHPMHLHGYSFYVVGRGSGNYNETKDPSRYNLVDPPFENTVGVPKNGWAAIRFKANNPGVWFMHCHLERHLSWGMDTVLIVKNGRTPDAQILPPPPDLPPC